MAPNNCDNAAFAQIKPEVFSIELLMEPFGMTCEDVESKRRQTSKRLYVRALSYAHGNAPDEADRLKMPLTTQRFAVV